jgi:ADP-ribose pyrophosphatase
MTSPQNVARQPEIAPVLKQKLLYQGRKFNFEVSQRRLPNGVEGEWELIQHPGGALVVPITNEGQLVLVRQYRFALAGRLLEFPAGTVEVGENPGETVKRELEEEAGYRGHTWQTIGQFPLAPGYSDEIIYAYLATDLEKLPNPPAQDEDEDIEVVLMEFKEFEKAIAQGEMVDAKSIASYFWMRHLL